MKAGLLGRKLGHSFSPQIHSMLGTYSYDLFEVEPEELGSFMCSNTFDAINVTIPYKKDVIPFCAELTETARAIGSVNTIVRRKDGTLLGDNTDAAGFSAMLEELDVNVNGSKCLVLGSGGASLTAVYVLNKLGASDVIVISRSGKDNYDNISRHYDADLIVNTTPVGMYPNNGISPLSLDGFDRLKGCVDVVYNPAKTRFLLDAEAKGIPSIGGLYMLVEQARAASERFTDTVIDPALTRRVYTTLYNQTRNIVLIGMPGSGKSTIAARLAEKTGRIVVDSDTEFVNTHGMSIPDYFAVHTEAEFRDAETAVLREITKRSGCIIATGGGAVVRSENRDLLRQNGMVFYLERELRLLPTKGRPISQANRLEDLYRVRHPLYRSFADAVVDNNSSIDETVNSIMEAFQ